MSEGREIRIKGRAVSRGVAIGPAVFLFGDRRQFFRRQIDRSEIENEISRYEKGSLTAASALSRDIERHRTSDGERIAEVLESHLLILQDPGLDSRIKEFITIGLSNAEWAIQFSFEQLSESLRGGSSTHLAEKYLDLEDVADRLLSELAGQSKLPQLKSGSIVVASELRASTLLQLRESEVAGVVTEHGGWTSHSSILARELGIPYVIGISHLNHHVGSETVAVVDGNNGEVVFDPLPTSVAAFSSYRAEKTEMELGNSSLEHGNLKTLDDRRVILRTNTTSPESYSIAKAVGAEGIGLYRSEALIGNYGRIPSEDEQLEEYIQIAAAAGPQGVRIRTFDIESEERQKNPALGLRAIRLGLLNPEILVPQIRALLRASAGGNIKIVVPMVNDATQIAAVRKLIDAQANELENANLSIGSPEVGAMIEIPSAALLADQIAQAADFLCLGTNDLAQYILAADRDNESVSELFRTLHPAMLRTVSSVIAACRKSGKPFVVCGEMAGSPFYVPVLIGMGATELSVGPTSIEPVRRVVSGIAFDEAAELVSAVMKLSSPDEVERTVAETAKSKWLHLYPSGFFDQHGR